MAEFGEILLRVNLAAAGAAVLILLLRGGVRRLFGARAAYALWLLVPVAVAAMLAPPRVVVVKAQTPAAEWLSLGGGAAAQPAAPFDPAPWLLGVWLAGVAVSGAQLVWRQRRFQRLARAGRAGPAAVGVLRQRIVLPADFDDRYAPMERRLILAHEHNHIAAHDPRINALAAVARCLAWFNPLAHVLARTLRLDQEFACDAAVVSAFPTARRAYAEAMLKAQVTGGPPPLGCHWSTHPLTQRVEALGGPLPGHGRRMAGLAAVSLLATALATTAWTARPAHVVTLAAPLRALSGPTPQAEAPPVGGGDPARAVRKAHATAATPSTQPPTPTPTSTELAPTAAAPDATIPPPAEPSAARVVHGAARRSYVEPGSAVRVLAAMTDAEGRHLVTDLTAFGSQNEFRTGAIERDGSRYSLFTAVEQRGATLHVTASLGGGFRAETSGSIDLRSGETGAVRLPNGLVVVVTPVLRSETAEELERTREWQARKAMRAERQDDARRRDGVMPQLFRNEPL